MFGRYEHSCELLNKRKADLLKVLNAGATAAYSSGKTKGKKHKEKEKVRIHGHTWYVKCFMLEEHVLQGLGCIV